jgi:uncharacterized membrane protein HdeD (DUF308 family)
MFYDLIQNWWALAIRGAVAILFGVLAFIWPGITLIALIVLFAAYALADGIFSIVAAANASKTGERWWALLLEGILGIIAGVVALFIPGVTALVLLYIIAFWAIITGIFEIVAAIRLRREISNEWLLLLNGIFSLILGAFLAVFPGIGVIALVLWIGAYALISGGFLLSLAIRLRTHRRQIVEA